VLFVKYNYNDKVKEEELGRECTTKENACKILVRKPEGERLLGRPRRRLVDNNQLDRKEIGWDVMCWIDLAQDRDQWRALLQHGNETSGSLK
jgi:hypothetical protein